MKRLFALLALVAAAGCGGGRPGQTHSVRIDVGGFVVYAFDLDEPLAGVNVSFADVEGATRTATTNSAGMWVIENIQPGVYTETFAAPGYEPQTRTFTIEAVGQNDVSNVFVGHDLVLLREEEVRMSVSPFDVTLRPDGVMKDGFEGVTMVYSTSADAAITVTFSRRITEGEVRLTDHVTGAFTLADPDATRTVWTIPEADIMSLNAGTTPADPALRHDQDPYTWQRLRVDVYAYTPIHGTYLRTQATAEFNATP